METARLEREAASDGLRMIMYSALSDNTANCRHQLPPPALLSDLAATLHFLTSRVEVEVRLIRLGCPAI